MSLVRAEPFVPQFDRHVCRNADTFGKAHYRVRLWPYGPVQVFRKTDNDPGYLELADDLGYLGDILGSRTSCIVDFQRLGYETARVGESYAYPFFPYI